ncbi:succinyldiaminopimelate aminotransferase [Actinocorallia herbida]|uniref:Aminotransferase n=1 Tax=Actinocorallia herbida TaxID=58109 RepID=A0A3N1CNJ2_9ACTN|nr:succinyldiaminopimelate transaminase [Actinocorallia herbida]ROO82897.1 succinyldiaminopimelate aminotransferase [Actinocorallia herbida]
MDLPDFPWDRLEPYKNTASAHPGGIVDLSVGTPVDPTPEVARRALIEAADSPGYPQTWGTPAVREAAAGWLARSLGVTVPADAVLPVIGTKEIVAWLPKLLDVRPGDTVVFPELAYPTYDVGARIAGATGVASDGLLTLGPVVPKMIWVNSPSNPTGRVLPPEHLRKVVSWARDRGVPVISDECYIELVWEGPKPLSILHPDISGGSHEGLLAIHSLSKRSNLAGYRAGFITGDPVMVKRLLEIRKHAGMIVPAPVQAAMAAAYGDDEHFTEQYARYAARRTALKAALEGHGFRVDHSEAALYLWATRDEACMETVAYLADLGILVAPGDFYGSAGSQHVRVAFTATDERIEQAVARLK